MLIERCDVEKRETNRSIEEVERLRDELKREKAERIRLMKENSESINELPSEFHQELRSLIEQQKSKIAELNLELLKKVDEKIIFEAKLNDALLVAERSREMGLKEKAKADAYIKIMEEYNLKPEYLLNAQSSKQLLPVNMEETQNRIAQYERKNQEL